LAFPSLYKSLPVLQKPLTLHAQAVHVFFTHEVFTMKISRMTVAGIVAAATLAGGVAALANGTGAWGWHQGTMTGTHSAADVSAHIDHLLKHLYVEIDATDAQKAQITPLVEQAVNDLLPLHAQLQAAHTQIIQALTASSVDRTALEAARVAHLQLADQASKRLAQLIGDVGDVLTPAQRNAFAAHVQQMTGGRGT
jgi:periplasmic protein CpxP/Spy